MTSHGVDDFMRFNLMPCLLTYSRLIKSYATFTGWSCDFFYVPFNEKIRLKKKDRAIGGGKTMGVEPAFKAQAESRDNKVRFDVQ